MKDRRVIAVSIKTKGKLDSIKFPGQSYDGLIQMLVDCWRDKHKPKVAQKEAVK